jgi:high-affinity iron transporter
MLATLVIGLREGLEAALIVGIIAAFLRRAGKPLRPMWIGVGIAVALSIAVGVTLELVSAELPQAQQEGMESVIGLVAVGVVTGMIGWMNTHARNMKAELEQHAAHALRDGTAWALVGMAFLAVLKEGFETSVFLLAAFQSSTSALAAGAGAVIGVAIAVAIGVGIFRGGVKLNLAKFFRITGIFLVFVAAGLVLSSLRTAHEAGWIVIGQQTTLNLSWLAPAGSVQAALLTGVLGIPADPRLIEVLGWFAYLIPTLAYLLWPVAKRPSATGLPRLRFGLAAAFAVAAVALAAGVVLPTTSPAAGAAQLTSSTGASLGHATLTSTGRSHTLRSSVGGAITTQKFTQSDTRATSHDGVAAREWQGRTSTPVTGKPSTISLDDLVALSGGRLPIGVNASANPGPFNASWETNSTTTAWLSSGSASTSSSLSTLLDATNQSATLLTLSGGGLPSSRVISLDAATPSWSVAQSYTDRVIANDATLVSTRSELLLWKLWLPLALALAALVLCCYGIRSLLKLNATRRQQQQQREQGRAEARAPQPASARA